MVALTGVGDVRERLKSYDFYRTLTNRPQADSLLLRDQSRSWFHNPAGRDALIEACRGIVNGGGYATVTFLGISMGAYGALSLGRLFPGARILAMSPPFSLDTARHGRNVVRHKRWLDANALHAPTDLDTPGENEHLILFGDAEPIDILNLQRFQAVGFPGLFVCPGVSTTSAPRCSASAACRCSWTGWPLPRRWRSWRPWPGPTRPMAPAMRCRCSARGRISTAARWSRPTTASTWRAGRWGRPRRICRCCPCCASASVRRRAARWKPWPGRRAIFPGAALPCPWRKAGS
ncbi:hypothetical protein [Teichococcus aestuarii]|uniref:hypothetical protein n=1 Tax=Teichococcus aestuarii TaxID=568898 RepID=UPI003607A36F